MMQQQMASFSLVALNKKWCQLVSNLVTENLALETENERLRVENENLKARLQATHQAELDAIAADGDAIIRQQKSRPEAA